MSNPHPAEREALRTLAQALADLSTATRRLTRYLDTEHSEALDGAWEAGNRVLTRIAYAPAAGDLQEGEKP